MIADEFINTTKEDWDLLEEFGISSKRNSQSSPSGNMSGGDMGMGAKRSFCHQRSSMSDFTDAVFASADDDTSDYDLIMPNCDIVTIAGVSETLQMHAKDIEQMSLPSASGRCFESVIPKPHPKAVVSLEYPYIFLMVSKEFCNLFGLSCENEICGKAINTLQGPGTDCGMLVSAIKDAALESTTRSSVVLYDRAGRDIDLDITFSPFLSGDVTGDESPAACVMELSLVPGGS
jgi:hypothetical protein